MNFLNDSLKSLKETLKESLDANVFDQTSSDGGDAEAKAISSQEKESLRKLVEHQSEEVKICIVLFIALFSRAHDFSAFDVNNKRCGGGSGNYQRKRKTIQWS